MGFEMGILRKRRGFFDWRDRTGNLKGLEDEDEKKTKMERAARKKSGVDLRLTMGCGSDGISLIMVYFDDAMRFHEQIQARLNLMEKSMPP